MEVSAPIFLAGVKLGAMTTGLAALRERLVSDLALRCLCGRSSPFYLRLYSEGLLNSTFGSGVDFAAGEGMMIFGGESKDPQAVTDALLAEAEAVAQKGFDPALFDRQKKAACGGRLRALNDFRGLAVSIVEGCFAGFQPMDAFAMLEGITVEDATAWVREHLVRERVALSIIRPKEG